MKILGFFLSSFGHMNFCSDFAENRGDLELIALADWRIVKSLGEAVIDLDKLTEAGYWNSILFMNDKKNAVKKDPCRT